MCMRGSAKPSSSWGWRMCRRWRRWCGWCAGACAITPPMRTICASFALENMQRGKWLKSSGELEAAESYRPVDSGRHFTARPAAGRLSGGARRARCPPVNQQFQLLSGVELYTFSSLYLDDPLPAIDDEAMVAHHCDIAVRAVIRFVIS